MKGTIIYLACLMSLFITITTANVLEIENVGSLSYGLFIFLFFYSVVIKKERLTLNRFKTENIVIGLFILYSVVQINYLGTEVIKQAFFFLAVPMLISMVVQIQPRRYKLNITKILILFFFLQCGIAIYEKILGINIFPYQNEETTRYIMEDWEFRSTAFLGHPLNNALCTSTILGFILISKFSLKFKFIAAVLGFTAILCFNARAATIILAITLIFYFYLVYRFYKSDNKLMLLWFSVGLFLTIVGFYGLLTQTELGGRLFNSEELVDGSARTRLEVLDTFKYIKGIDLLVGNPNLYLDITDKLGAAGIENFYIVMILRYGVIFGISVIIFLFLYLYQKMKYYRYKQKIIIFLLFIGIGSMNNSLGGATPWIIFILCVQSFPCMALKNYKYKHIIVKTEKA